MIMITVTILALVLGYKSFCNTVCIYMVMQIKLVVVVVVVVESPKSFVLYFLIRKAFRDSSSGLQNILETKHAICEFLLSYHIDQ